jgi:hypothetical protein
MELPHDLCLEIASYVPIRPLLAFRVASKAMVEYAKGCKGGPVKIRSLHKWRACFPYATQANITGLLLQEDDMKYLDKVHDLDMTFCDPYIECTKMYSFDGQFVNGTNWFHLPGLKKLTVGSNGYMTDQWLEFFTELEELYIGYCSRTITGSGFRAMKKLKRLTLNSMLDVKDDAFIGLPVEDLSILRNSRITDKGIRHLKRLTKLYLSHVIRVKGHGYEELPLKQIFVNDLEIDRDTFQSFSRIPHIMLSSCSFLDTSYDMLKNVQSLTVYDSTFEEPTKLLTLPQFMRLKLVRCTPISDIVKEKMGNRLIEQHHENWGID